MNWKKASEVITAIKRMPLEVLLLTLTVSPNILRISLESL